MRALPSSRPTRHPAERGFLLVEALVALAIVGLMAGLVFESVWQMGRTATDAANRREAMLLARSISAAAQAEAGTPAISPRGVDGAMTWQIAVEPFDGEGSGGGVRLERVRVTIGDAATGTVLARLDSMRTKAL